MKLTSKGVNAYGYVSIVLMLGMVLMIFMQWVPRSWHYPLFAVAVTLYMIRITMRLILSRQERIAKADRADAAAPDESSEPK